ncbi:MAG: hypothetical protein A2096_04520 [Spirochaetes bacterium GWF1_41_5]|nr:MAG: hypothetical protein A2096_04520 [Spirochaetes bacterium GWF1_41_5]HBE03570.1 hypothetical protein [Spirochaetia bacterium]
MAFVLYYNKLALYFQYRRRDPGIVKKNSPVPRIKNLPVVRRDSIITGMKQTSQQGKIMRCTIFRNWLTSLLITLCALACTTRGKYAYKLDPFYKILDKKKFLFSSPTT